MAALDEGAVGVCQKHSIEFYRWLG